MVIAISNSYTHNANCGGANFKSKELEQTVINNLEKLGFTSQDINWNEQGYLEIKNPSDLKLHTLMLQMESLGLELKMTKQTLIEVC